jgi:uncharacterized protein
LVAPKSDRLRGPRVISPLNLVLITADSVSMISEAAATVKRVHVIDLDGGGGEFRRFHEAMRSVGTTRPFSDRIESSSYWVPDDTARAGAAPRGPVLGRRTRT